MSMRIGVDLGGTKIEAAAVDADERMLLRRRVPTPRHSYPAICAAIATLVHAIEQDLGCAATVGIGIPGTLEPATGHIKNANTVCLIGEPFLCDMEAQLVRPVRVANDANCFVVSEAVDGAAAGCDSAFGVIIGTGTGGGLYADGHARVGANGIAGEWGHNPVPWPRLAGNARSCYCGRGDCLETYLSGAGLTRTCNEIGPAHFASVEAIAAAVATGDNQAARALALYAEQLAYALGTVINLFDPTVIVLGGGLSNLPDICAAVAGRLLPYVFSDTLATRVVKAVHGDSSGVRGAAWLWTKAEAVVAAASKLN